MHVAAVIKRKGSDVVTIGPDKTIGTVTRLLTAHRIGAAVVANSRHELLGIISERDVIRGMAEHGEKVCHMKVADLMTRDVQTCQPSDTIAEIMAMMTRHRFRHMPVVENGKLLGIISIGDVVKQRLDETEVEVESLRSYVIGR